jgi:hypothetical protein
LRYEKYYLIAQKFIPSIGVLARERFPQASCLVAMTGPDLRYNRKSLAGAYNRIFAPTSTLTPYAHPLDEAPGNKTTIPVKLTEGLLIVNTAVE